MQDDPQGSPSACWGLSPIPPPLPAEAFGSSAPSLNPSLLLVSCPELWLWAGKEAPGLPTLPVPQPPGARVLPRAPAGL